jgi:hypothetical protein
MSDDLFIEDCMKADCEEELRAKDARIQELESALQQIATQSEWSEWSEHTRELSRNNKAIARRALHKDSTP